MDKTVVAGPSSLAFDEDFVLPMTVLSLPGHTRDHIGYYFHTEGVLFSGDVLFSMGCGRLFEGTAAQMWHSLKQIKGLPRDTVIFSAHEYTTSNGKFARFVEPNNSEIKERCRQVAQQRSSSLPTVPVVLKDELMSNPFLRCDDPVFRETFAKEGESPESVFARLRTMKDTF